MCSPLRFGRLSALYAAIPGVRPMHPNRITVTLLTRMARHSKSEPSARGNTLPFALRALGHRNYQLFFGGQLISLTGTWMQSVAQSWLVYRLTGSSALLGVAAFASQIPVFLFATIGGTVADRANRHRILIITQSVSMVLPLTLA